MDTQGDVWEDQMAIEEGIADMLHDFFCDDLPHALVGNLDKEAKNRHECEAEIKEQCNQMLFKGKKYQKYKFCWVFWISKLFMAGPM